MIAESQGIRTMITTIQRKRTTFTYRVFSAFVAFTFIFSSIIVVLMVTPLAFADTFIASDGTYVGGLPELSPQGTYVDGTPKMTPDGYYVDGIPKKNTLKKWQQKRKIDN